jgi:hypothetical protein
VAITSGANQLLEVDYADFMQGTGASGVLNVGRVTQRLAAADAADNSRIEAADQTVFAGGMLVKGPTGDGNRSRLSATHIRSGAIHPWTYPQPSRGIGVPRSRTLILRPPCVQSKTFATSIYYGGIYVPQDYAEAYRWYKRLEVAEADPCSPLSGVRGHLIHMYREGLDVPRDLDKANQLLRFHEGCA